MKRRQLLTGIAASIASVPYAANLLHGADPVRQGPAMYHVRFGEKLRLNLQSPEHWVKGESTRLISLGSTFVTLDDANRMQAKVKASVVQLTDIEYWVSMAAFSDNKDFVGAATKKITIRPAIAGVPTTVLEVLEFDFGVSQTFKNASQLAVTISVP